MQHPADDSQDDDLAWFDLIAGRTTSQASGQARADAALLRQVAQAAPVQVHGEPSPVEARTRRLLARAREAGVVPAEVAAAAPDLRRRWVGWVGAFVAGTAMASLVGVVSWQLLTTTAVTAPEPDAPPVQRGVPAVQRLKVTDPVAMRADLMAQLRDAGADVQPFERLGRVGFDAELPQRLPGALRERLAQLGLHLDGPFLLVEFEPALSGGEGTP